MSSDNKEIDDYLNSENKHFSLLKTVMIITVIVWSVLTVAVAIPFIVALTG